jgi:hypothetical protein
MARTETKMMGLSFGGEWMPVLKYSVKWCSICIVCATNCHLAWREGGESLDFLLTPHYRSTSIALFCMHHACISPYKQHPFIPHASPHPDCSSLPIFLANLLSSDAHEGAGVGAARGISSL